VGVRLLSDQFVTSGLPLRVVRIRPENKILPHNPCRIRGAGTEDAGERPVLTLAQVFELAEQAGRRPVGNIRSVTGGYRLRFRRHGEMRTSSELYGTR
jgi:hypothetical protein